MNQSELSLRELSYSLTNTKHTATWSVVATLIFLGAVCFSLQGPFYPAEAELKGVQPSEYGFVFGVFQLVILLTAPIFGNYVKVLGDVFLFKTGLFICSLCTVLFGFLDLSPPGQTFLWLSIGIRIVAALGESAMYTSSYVIIIRCFAKSVATGLALVEICFGLGSILGPTVGGGLYELGGFRLPFVVMGSVLLFGFLVSVCFVTGTGDSCESSGTQPTIMSVLYSPVILIVSFLIFLSSLSTGFFLALLEPHLRSLQVTPLQVGLVFMSNGITYVIASATCGRIVDKFHNAKTMLIIGSFLQIASFVIVGPLPFIPLQKSVATVTLGVIISGLGIGAVLVTSVVSMMNELLDRGFPRNLALQGFVSGLFNALYAAGCFVGPTGGGIVYDAYGFPSATLVVCGLHVIGFVFALLNYIVTHTNEFPNAKTRLAAHNKSNTSFSESIKTIA